MASTTLYPPILDSTSEAFIVGNKCRIYYSLSKFSSSAASSIKSVHISVIRQSSGISAVNKSNLNNRYRSAGIIILNTPPTPSGTDGLYYVDILPEDIIGGWTSGAIYKIQIRLSSITYNGIDGIESWMNTNASYFSEWSTYCTTKAIAKPVVHIAPFSYTNTGSSAINEVKFYNISASTIDFIGTYSNNDPSENLYSYSLKLYNEDNDLIEDSGVIYPGQYENFNKFNYIIKKEFKNGESWKIVLEYSTTNKYTESITFNFVIDYVSEQNLINIATIDQFPQKKSPHLLNNNESEISINSSLEEENNEGRIALKLYSENDEYIFYGNIYIRRASSKDNFLSWEDIITIPVEYPGIPISDIDIVYDNTIESGIWYKYGVQSLKYAEGIRSVLNVIPKPIIREFDYNFLVGENGQQLKLPFNTEMNTYSYTIMENKVDPISGEFPIISRNAKLKYRTFPFTTLISLHMDDMKLFLTEEEIFENADIADLYKDKRSNDDCFYYDYIQERFFREKVLEFLQDGKPKLFKSATEGNIIVRLVSVTESPNQTLGRMIGTINSTAYEIAKATIDNYKKYNFIVDKEPLGKFVTYSKHFGQCIIEDATSETNIISAIFEKYNHSSAPIGGIRYTLKTITDLKIEINGEPITLSNGYVGYQLTTPSGTLQTINPVYDFGKEVVFDKTSVITVNGDSATDVIATFVYEITSEDWVDRELLSLSYVHNLGQIYQEISKNTNNSIYELIVQKHSYEWGNSFSEVENLLWGTIECDPGTVLIIKDSADATGEELVMNGTGRFDLADLGEIYDVNIKFTGTDESKVIMINYVYTAKQGTYKEED